MFNIHVLKWARVYWHPIAIFLDFTLQDFKTFQADTQDLKKVGDPLMYTLGYIYTRAQTNI